MVEENHANCLHLSIGYDLSCTYILFTIIICIVIQAWEVSSTDKYLILHFSKLEANIWFIIFLWKLKMGIYLKSIMKVYNFQRVCGGILVFGAG